MRGRVAGTWHPLDVHEWEPYDEGAIRSLCGGLTASINCVLGREMSVTCSGCKLAIQAEEHPIGEKTR